VNEVVERKCLRDSQQPLRLALDRVEEMKSSGKSVRFATTGAVSARRTNDATAKPSAVKVSPPSRSTTNAAARSR
jgi:hypothetical protein